jgi:hypothetical protein
LNCWRKARATTNDVDNATINESKKEVI